MTRVRLDWVLEPVRETVPLEEIQANTVFHYSIPFLDEFGDGAWQDGSEIESAKQRVHGGEVLISRLNPRKSRVHITSTREGLSVCSGEFVVLRPRPGNSPKFLQYLLASDAVRSSLDSQVRSVTRSQQRVEPAAITKMWVELPPEDEQRRIVEVLDAEAARIDELIEEQELQRRLLTSRFLTTVRQAVTGRLGGEAAMTIAGPYWLGPTPLDWAAWKVGQCFRTGSGTTPSSANPDYYNGPHPWVNTAELRESVIRDTAKSLTDEAFADHSTLTVYEPGSLVIAMYGATIGRVGVLGVPAAVNQACCVLSGETAVRLRFAFYWFMGYRAEIAQLGQGGGQPNINQELIRQLRIPAPGLDEQDRLVDFLDNERRRTQVIDDECATQIALLREHRQALIAAAVTGGMDALRKVA